MVISKRKKLGHLAHGLLLPPPTMKDLASCFSEHAVRVSDTSCSGSSSGGSSSVVVAENNTSNSSVLSAVTCLYRTRLSTRKELLVRVTWSKSHAGPVLSIDVDDEPSLHDRKPGAAMDCQLLRKKKGSRSYVSGSTNVGLYWDISSAKYNSAGPEPIDEFYVVVIVNAEYALLLGDLSKDYIKRFEETMPTAEFSMVSRKEQILGHALYSTRARFCHSGGDHEITIRCTGDGWEAKDSELWVSIDKKRVVYVRRLRWNFRGNQTVFIDGLPVDMMWDVHDWLRSSPSTSGHAIFLFRTRSALESRLWLEEEKLNKEKGVSGFSLLIQAFKTTA